MKNEIEMKEENQEEYAFQHEVQKRLAIVREKKVLILLCAALLVVFLAVTFVPSPFEYDTRSSWFNALRSGIGWLGNGLVSEKGGPIDSPVELWFWRYVALMVVGAAMSLSGAVYQGEFRNTMASPTTMGAIAGGTLGTILHIMTLGTPWAKVDNAMHDWGESLGISFIGETLMFDTRIFFVFGGAFGAVLLTAAVAKLAGKGEMTMLTLIVSGMVVSGGINAAGGIIRYWYLSEWRTNLEYYQLSLMNLANSANVNSIWSVRDCAWYVVPLCVLIVVMILLAGKLNLLVFGTEEARILGIDTRKFRMAMLILCTLIVSVAMAGLGSVGFVGLIMPNIARKLVGPDFRYLIPASALLGGIYLLIIAHLPAFDWLDQYNYISPMSSLYGGIAFIVILIINRRNRNADWAR